MSIALVIYMLQSLFTYQKIGISLVNLLTYKPALYLVY